MHIVGNGEDYLCPCCQEIFTWPELTHCGHAIDKQCIRDQSCPTCSKPLLWTVPNIMIEREVKTVKIHCINEDAGCPFMGSIEDMDSHINQCEYELVVCDLYIHILI